jgi:hypothetical protein
MENLISPRYLMALIKSVETAIWKEYPSYKEVKLYIKKWHVIDSDSWNNYSENFAIVSKNDNGDIDLVSTLHGIDGNTLLKIAVDMLVETPDFIPSVATFRNDIKTDYKTANATFNNAFKQIEEHPDLAVGLANSALESIVKEILKDTRISVKTKVNDTLYDLTSNLLKEFKLFPNSGLPSEIKTIGSSILAAAKAIEELPSTSTSFHGKTNNDYIVDDSVYTYFVVNSVTTVGLFLNNFYKNKFPNQTPVSPEEEDLPF